MFFTSNVLSNTVCVLFFKKNFDINTDSHAKLQFWDTPKFSFRGYTYLS